MCGSGCLRNGVCYRREIMPQGPSYGVCLMVLDIPTMRLWDHVQHAGCVVCDVEALVDIDEDADDDAVVDCVDSRHMLL